jgi:hypothetical protein
MTAASHPCPEPTEGTDFEPFRAGGSDTSSCGDLRATYGMRRHACPGALREFIPAGSVKGKFGNDGRADCPDMAKRATLDAEVVQRRGALSRST